MISIIICSKDQELFFKVKENIRNTVGVPFEIIEMNNEDGKFGICSAYNKGADKANFEILCFLHEDTNFETHNWGEIIISHLSDKSVGLIGIAGGDTKSFVPSSWSSFIYPSEISIVQHFKSTGKMERIVRTGDISNPQLIKPVICIDGVFMCTRKDVFSKFRFDEKTFPEFHGYDLDYSLQVGTSLKECMIFDLFIPHFSEVSFHRHWLNYTMKLSDKWKYRLPVSVRNLKESEYINQHWTSMRNFIKKQIELDYKLHIILKNYFKYSFTQYFHFMHFLHFLRIILLVKLANSEKYMQKIS